LLKNSLLCKVFFLAFFVKRNLLKIRLLLTKSDRFTDRRSKPASPGGNRRPVVGKGGTVFAHKILESFGVCVVYDSVSASIATPKKWFQERDG
jgi:hypothetical protein